ncbi:MAG: glycoside hydrolase family 13 protein, partial [Cytophagales bacterium]|nr:glycoside hydrolase family 13 protein [Cytophagales bacterium]
TGFYSYVQMRRYGGDLQGILDKLDYLQDLGITALYINPLNDAPSLHKYDARHYRHIDRNFGPDPKGDEAIIAKENPVDPATWQMTSADKLFIKLIREAHKRNMKVVLDYSWNHTGSTFWAWQDVLKNQKNSPYADWYEIERFDDPATPENEFSYKGWANVHTLPEINKINEVNRKHGHPYEGNIHNGPKQHIFNVSKRWMDPNGDGDPSDGVDGYRMDVADQIPMGFWRDYRKFLRGINPEFYLIGEIWWEEWPGKLMDPRPYMQGDIFDAVMHYQWYKPARAFFAQTEEGMKPTEFVNKLQATREGIKERSYQAMMNLTASHDSPRLLSSLYNRENAYKYMANPRDNKTYKLHSPTESKIWASECMLLLHQFTFPGSPQIWNGDEFGMTGADDPDNRKPVIWSDMQFAAETATPPGVQKPVQSVKANMDLANYYKKLIALRKNHKALIYGSLKFEIADDAKNVLAYSRKHQDEEILVLFNRSEQTQDIRNNFLKGSFKELLTNKKTKLDGKLSLPPLSGTVLLKK